MLLICPACDTYFRIAPETLGADGRDVQCVRCRATWFAEAAQIVPEAIDIETGPGLVPPAAPLLALPAPAPAETVAGELIEFDTSHSTPALAPALADYELSAGPRRKPQPKPRRRSLWLDQLQARIAAGARHIPAAGTVGVGLVLLIGVLSPSTLVRAAPDLAGLYGTLGITVNLRGLELREVRTLREVDGGPVLVAEGKIANISGRELELPRLHLTVLNAGGFEIYRWTSQPRQTSIAAGEVISFRSRLRTPPTEAKHVAVRFVQRGDEVWDSR